MLRALSLIAGVTACGSGAAGPDAAGTPDAGLPAVDAALPDAAAGPTFLDPDVLHDIAITIAPGDLVQFDEDQTMRVHCDVTIDGTVLADCGCRKKGGVGSVDPVSGKPAFSIKLDEYVVGQKYAGVDKIVLDNSIQDPSLLHEHLAYDVFRRAGVPAHRTAFTVASLNGEPRGIYVAVEPVDKEFLRNRYGAANDQGNLYEASTVDFVLDPDSMELKDPAGRSRADITAAAAAVQGTDDATFASVVGALIDLDEFAAFFAVEIVIDAEDGLAFGRNNYFMYHRPDTDRFVFLPHGQDVIMENAALDADYPPGPRLSARVHAIPALRATVDAAVTAAIGSGGAADPSYLASRITQAVALVATTTRTDDFTTGDLAAMARTAPVLAAQFAWRATWIAGAAPLPRCGDTVVQGGEQCDDGNEVPGDGCDDQCFPECTPAFVEAGGTWRLCPGHHDWATQVATCQALGGQVAYPTDAADAADITSIMRRRLAAEDFWLGLTDVAVEDSWLTAAGAGAPHLTFAPNEPNGGAGENCLLSDTGFHRDRPCDQGFAALCRMP
jgi:cysteine-rich repeat protein